MTETVQPSIHTRERDRRKFDFAHLVCVALTLAHTLAREQYTHQRWLPSSVHGKAGELKTFVLSALSLATMLARTARVLHVAVVDSFATQYSAYKITTKTIRRISTQIRCILHCSKAHRQTLCGMAVDFSLRITAHRRVQMYWNQPNSMHTHYSTCVYHVWRMMLFTVGVCSAVKWLGAICRWDGATLFHRRM